ncbi:MAG: molybdopterin cofactor-binding domain-containing protein [Pseudomonadales bacterium]|nr:molybdopterin cofactor-binding domain-containing protein [Pseudomonadales bacterium]
MNMKKPADVLPLKRRDLLKAGGALTLGFTWQHTATAQSTSTDGFQSGPPDAEQIDSWIAIHSDNTATLYMGFAELGQGCSTALLQVAAEELDLAMSQISTVGLDTHLTPNQGGTYSSSAMRRGGPQVQRAAAEARQALLQMAAARLQVPVASLQVDNGIISGTGDDNVFTSYGELIGDQRFNLAFTGTAALKNPRDYRLVAQAYPRNDIPLKAAGSYTFLQHRRLPGMLHARIVRPRGQGAYKDGVQVISIDDSSIASIPAARVVRQENFVAVVAENEWDAVRAAQTLKVQWRQADNLPGNEKLFTQMEQGVTNERIAVDRGDITAFAAAPHQSVFRATAPYQAHGPFAPNCALADVKADSALVLCASQDVYNTRSSIATLLGLPEQQVRIQYHESSGTYGHSCWDDAAQAAALTSQLVARPVRLQFMRWDELGWDTYGPAHVGSARVAADRAGNILSYEYEGWQHHWSLIETSAQSALGIPAAEWPPFPAQQINPRTLGGMYDIPNMKLLNHHVPGLDYLKGAWLRSPMDLSFAFVSEQAIDDLAFQLRMDPWQFRRRNITNYHWRDVLDAAATAATWEPRPAASQIPADAVLVRGRGIGLGTHLSSYGGAVADIEVNRQTGKVRILHLYGAIDAGLVVNPSNVENQITGQLVQTASRLLFEEVHFDSRQVTSLDWNSYPVLRFEDCPDITPRIVQRLDEAPSGAGEEVMAAAASAIANAFFDATGKRMTMYPFTPQRVLAALNNYG